MKKQLDEWYVERRANEAILKEFRKIQIAEYKHYEKRKDEFNDNWRKGIRKFNKNYFFKKDRISEKISAMDLEKLEKLISMEQTLINDIEKSKSPFTKENELGSHLLYKLLYERKMKIADISFKWTDKKYQKFVQLNNSLMESYKLAKEEAQAIHKLLRKRKSNSPLLKNVDDYFEIDIIIRPVFYDWDRLYQRRRDYKWQKKNKQLENKYDFYEALEWAFEKYCMWDFEARQNSPSYFEHKTNEQDPYWDKDPNGNLGPENGAFEWIPPDSKYYWQNRLCYAMHCLATHTFLTKKDILEIKRLEVEFRINFGEMKNSSKQ